MTRSFAAAVPALGLSVLIGCARPPIQSARISEDLLARTGQSLNTNATPQTVSLPPDIDIEDGVSESEAVVAGLWTNPAFNEALTELGVSRADLIHAGMLSNPTFSMLFPAGPKQLEFTATFPLEAFWLRPRRIAVARVQAERTAQLLVQRGLDFVRDIKFAYIHASLAQERARLAREALDVRSRISELSEKRLRGGDVSELEAATARVDALRAKEESARAQYDAQLALEKLRLLTGLPAAPKLSAARVAPPVTTSLDQLERLALAARPDLRASELAIEAAAKRAGLAKAEIFAVSALLDANGKESGGLEMGPGMQLPIPVFNRNQAGIARAKAEMERAAWNYLAVKERVRSEVRDAHTRWTQAQETLREWQDQILPPLEATTHQAERAYQLGEVSLLLVHEHTRQFITARLRFAEIAADARAARAELERSVGHRIERHNDE